jgi:hypothetical protein
VTTIGLAAFTRADMPAQERRNFFVYVDEFQSFTTLALVNLFSELRKYRLGFTVAHQYLHQLEPDIRHAVLGNAGTLVSFPVGAEDAPYLEREFVEQFEQIDHLSAYGCALISPRPNQLFALRFALVRVERRPRRSQTEIASTVAAFRHARARP